MNTPSKPATFSRQDAAQIVMGCASMAFPVATADEIWKLGEELSFARVLLFAIASIAFLAVIIYHVHHGVAGEFDRRVFLNRVLCTYGLTLLISALILLGVDRFDLLVDPMIGLKRAILVAFPASFAATVVDSIH
jgi:uncharacterized membrane protein